MAFDWRDALDATGAGVVESIDNWRQLLAEWRDEVCPPGQRLPHHVDVCAGRWVAGSQPITPDARCAT